MHITKDLTWNKRIHQITATANRTLAFIIIGRNLYSCPQHINKSAYITLVRPLLAWIFIISMGPPHQDIRKQNRNGPKTCSYFCHNDYKTIEKGWMSEMIGKLILEPLNIRRTNRRLTIFPKSINGHLALPIGHLQPVLRRTRHLNSKAYTCRIHHVIASMTTIDLIINLGQAFWSRRPHFFNSPLWSCALSIYFSHFYLKLLLFSS